MIGNQHKELQEARLPWRLTTRRIVLIGALLAVMAAAYFVASSLAEPRSGPSIVDRQIENMEAAIPDNPNDLSLRLSLASAYMKDSQIARALAQYQEALVIEPTSEVALLGAGLAHYRLGQNGQAVQAFNSVVAVNEQNPFAQISDKLETAHYYLGRIYREEGKLDEAVAELRRAIGINRSDADALYELGLAFHAKGEYADAASAFQVALAFVPDYTEAYQGLADAARAQGDEVKAGYAEAMLLVFQGKAKDGVRRLESLAPESEDSRLWWGLGYANEQIGDVEAARAAYERAVEINPGEMLAADALRRLSTTE